MNKVNQGDDWASERIWRRNVFLPCEENIPESSLIHQQGGSDVSSHLTVNIYRVSLKQGFVTRGTRRHRGRLTCSYNSLSAPTSTE